MNKLFKKLLLTAFTVVFSGAITLIGMQRSSKETNQDFVQVQTKIDDYLNALASQGLFSGSVLVAQNGNIFAKGYGMANYEHDVSNTPQTKFRLGSITKTFTAMAIMQLQEKGLLSINDTLSKYITDYPNGDKITIHHLLTHSSGIPNLTAFAEYRKKKSKPHTTEQLVERFKNKPLDFQPGEEYKYSNSGYMLLTYIIEKASGKKYETVLQENIFTPLNMNNSGYDKSSLVIKNRASGYRTLDNKLVNAGYIDMSFPSGAGGLYSTVEDLYLLDQALYSEKLLSKESLNKAFTPHVVTKNNDPNSPCYGYGWGIAKEHNRNYIGHSGGIDGFSTKIARYPDDKLCIIILGNRDDVKASIIYEKLATIIFGEDHE